MIVEDLTKGVCWVRSRMNNEFELMKISGRRVRVRLSKFWNLPWKTLPRKIWNFANFTKYQSCKVILCLLLVDDSELVEFVLKRWSRIELMKISGRRVRVRLSKFWHLTQTSPPTKIWNFANFTKYQSCKTKQTTQLVN